ncbi:MAG: hypothetical protein IT303_08340 [Dehalococcoidia bacterium]|nr:hypothetical protein [Dehalococcoidia bacterium]
MSRRAPAAAPPSPARPAWQGPKVVIPVILVLALATLAMGGAWAMKDGGAQVLRLESCEAGTPGCELRAPTHLHADFALYVDGQRFDFDRPEFISEEGNDLAPDVHIHEPRATVVHVHRSNTTWDMFFSSLGFELVDPSLAGGLTGAASLELPDGTVVEPSGDATFKFIVNGVEVDGISGENIGDLDRVLVSFGTESLDTVMRDQWPQVTDQACIPSERCTERIPADEPPERCAKSDASCTS